MKRFVLLIALLGIIASTSQAQFLGSGSADYQTGMNPSSSRPLATKIGNWICGMGVGMGCVYTLVGATTDLEEMLFVGLGLIGGSTLIATPFWIAGARQKRKFAYTSYAPLLERDFQLNDDLTFTTSLGTSCGNIPGMDNSFTAGPGVGVSLRF